MFLQQAKERYGARNSSIELLRLVAMFGIVLIHTFGHGSGLDYEWIYGLAGDWSTTGHFALVSLGEAGVTIFIFISGWYGMRIDIKKIIALISTLMFYALINCIISGSSPIGTIITLLHPWDGWWFIKSYMIIWMLVPFIEMGMKQLSKRQLQAIIGFLVFYTYVGHFFIAKMDQNTDLLITIYITARYLKNYPPHLEQNYTVLASFRWLQWC